MAELPGWDRGRLAAADPRDVEAASLIVYARAWAPAIGQDIDGQIESLEADIRQAEASRLKGSAHELAMANETKRSVERLRAAIERLRKAKGHQDALRLILELDVDEAPA
jgi:hypothetical protein